MHFPTLMAEADVPPEVADLTAELIARKAVTRELGVRLIPPPVLAFIDAELALAAEAEPERRPLDPQARAEADGLFRTWTWRLDGGASRDAPPSPRCSAHLRITVLDAALVCGLEPSLVFDIDRPRVGGSPERVVTLRRRVTACNQRSPDLAGLASL